MSSDLRQLSSGATGSVAGFRVDYAAPSGIDAADAVTPPEGFVIFDVPSGEINGRSTVRTYRDGGNRECIIAVDRVESGPDRHRYASSLRSDEVLIGSTTTVGRDLRASTARRGAGARKVPI